MNNTVLSEKELEEYASMNTELTASRVTVNLQSKKIIELQTVIVILKQRIIALVNNNK